ncbi:hypothetical protein E3N88_44836 [Mikania micrantha]|uniref:Protein kinase domain-containing protein n=1 Tax=Mikania micrantha TaxID=192012 RepID=A0A5N6L6V8_9ASTR|nr:hypothetical protein E3N88_46225 [Mikania micrantha]KAD0066209.1 hypothetical protein E3N88_44836 [Mikania micrantha]
MKCFPFSHREEKDQTSKTPTKSLSIASFFSGLSWTGFNSQTVSDISTASASRANVPNFSQSQSNLKVFTFAELRSATNGFSRSAKIGEGGFGCVFFGSIKSPQDPSTKVHVAVKQLGRRGLQASTCYYIQYPRLPLKSPVHVVPSVQPIEPEKVFVEPTEGKKTSEDMPSEGKRRVIGIKFGETAWLSRIWPSKLLKT